MYSIFVLEVENKGHRSFLLSNFNLRGSLACWLWKVSLSLRGGELIISFNLWMYERLWNKNLELSFFSVHHFKEIFLEWFGIKSRKLQAWESRRVCYYPTNRNRDSDGRLSLKFLRISLKIWNLRENALSFEMTYYLIQVEICGGSYEVLKYRGSIALTIWD